ncbi:MAG: hypothetical protein V4588_02120, partial [Pseudomonadota bacterium]
MNDFSPGGAAPAVDDVAPVGSAANAPQPTAGVFSEFSTALASAHAGLSHLLELLSLEARRAGLALTWMIASGV